MEIKIKTLTPIWTGGVDRKCDRIHETGIIGSLRWWYEAIVRGLGGYACDPTSKNESKNEKERCPDKNNNHCAVCEVFGCTGWGRKFRIVIKNDEYLQKVDSNVRNRKMHHFVPIKGLCTLNNTKDSSPDKPVIIELVSLRMEEMEYRILNKVFKLIEKYGGLGANLSQGNGIIKIIESELDTYTTSLSSSNKTIPEWIKERAKLGTTTYFPVFDRFFFGEFQLVFNQKIDDLLEKNLFFDEGIVNKKPVRLNKDWKDFWDKFRFLPIAPHIRFAIRSSISNRNQRHEVFGYVDRNKNYTFGSKVFVSHGYKVGNQDNSVNFRIYGYSLSDNEIDAIGDFLRQGLEGALFQDGKQGGRIKQLKANSSFLIDNGKTTVTQLSQIVVKGEELLNGL